MSILHKFMYYLGFPILISVKHADQSVIPVNINCPLCEESPKWSFPKQRNNLFGFHFKLGYTWKPEKGHPQYELHNKLHYHLKVIHS